MLTCPSNNKKMFLVPVLLLKYICFSFFNSVFCCYYLGVFILLFFFNMHCCFRLPGCLGSDSELRACKLWGGDLWMATLKVGWSLNLCSSQGGKKKDLRNKEFLRRHLLNSVIFKILMQNLKCIIEWWSTFCVDVKHAKANQWMRRPGPGKASGDHCYSFDTWEELVHVAKVYQLWGASGFFWGLRKWGDFCYFRIFKHRNQRPNSKQPSLFKVKLILFAENTCMVDCKKQLYDYLYIL